MYIYNVTTKIDWSIADEWVKWMQEVHIPELMNLGLFDRYQLVRLVDVDEAEGPTYAAQYYVASKLKYDDYIANHAPKYRQHANVRWGNKFISFRTLMELI